MGSPWAISSQGFFSYIIINAGPVLAGASAQPGVPRKSPVWIRLSIVWITCQDVNTEER